MCDAKNVKVNGDAKKPSYEVKKGDNLEIKYYSNIIKAKVLEIPKEALKKEQISEYISFIN